MAKEKVVIEKKSRSDTKPLKDHHLFLLSSRAERRGLRFTFPVQQMPRCNSTPHLVIPTEASEAEGPAVYLPGFTRH